MFSIKHIIFIMALLPLAMCQAADEKYKAGEHYDVLPQQVRTANPDKVEVKSFCLYLWPLLQFSIRGSCMG